MKAPVSVPRAAPHSATLGGAPPHLELVELEQVTVTAASEGGQQTALLRTPLRARPSGGMRLRRDAHALRGRRPHIRRGVAGRGWGSWPTHRGTGYLCPYRILGGPTLSSGSLSSQLPSFLALGLSVPVPALLVSSPLCCSFLPESTCAQRPPGKANNTPFPSHLPSFPSQLEDLEMPPLSGGKMLGVYPPQPPSLSWGPLIFPHIGHHGSFLNILTSLPSLGRPRPLPSSPHALSLGELTPAVTFP